jgi:hypothetical protein
MRAMLLSSSLSLALLVFGVLADHPHYAAPVDHLALVANLLYGCPDFHWLNSPREFLRSLALAVS